MNKNNSTFWRVGVLLLILVIVPVSIRYYSVFFTDVDTARMLNASVSIKTISNVRIDNLGDSVWKTQSGSGFLVNRKRCEIWTNAHVVDDAAMIQVFPRGWQSHKGIEAKLVSADTRVDIAVLRISHCEGMEPIKLGKSSLVQAGDEIYAVGNPLGRNPDSISKGIVSHTNRFTSSAIAYLQTDASINMGNSGGALFNTRGEVIGVNTAIAVDVNGSNAGIGYAIPVDVVRKTVKELLAGHSTWGDAGLTEFVNDLSAEAAQLFGIPDDRSAMIVTKNPDKGPTVGVLEKRDVIYAINKNRITSVYDGLRIISQYKKDMELTFGIIRRGEKQNVNVVLAAGPETLERPRPDSYEGYLGLTLTMWNDESGEKALFKQPIITKVHSLSPAHRSQITSTQHYMTRSGPFLLSYLLDVRTITGVIYEGEYHPVNSTEDVDRLSSRAFEANRPLLLEIENWRRASPFSHEQPLERINATFYRLQPAPGPATDSSAHAALGDGSASDGYSIRQYKSPNTPTAYSTQGTHYNLILNPLKSSP